MGRFATGDHADPPIFAPPAVLDGVVQHRLDAALRLPSAGDEAPVGERRDGALHVVEADLVHVKVGDRRAVALDGVLPLIERACGPVARSLRDVDLSGVGERLALRVGQPVLPALGQRIDALREQLGEFVALRPRLFEGDRELAADD